MPRLPPKGLPMRRALLILIPKGHPMRPLLDQFLAMEGRASRAELRPIKQGIWSEAQRQEQDGLCLITGIPPGETQPDRIATGLVAHSCPDFERQTLATDIGTFSAVLICSAPPQAASQSTEPSPNTLESAPVTRTRGGRKPQHDWPAFIREMIRFANRDGFEGRREMADHMRQWCATNWSTPPDDSTVSKKIKEWCPEDQDN